MNTDRILATLQDQGVHIGLRVLGALVIWFVGRWIISALVRVMGVALSRRHVDATLARYAQNVIRITLNVALIIAVLGFFGVETTSFAALIAAAGVAIGMAWSGLLANFAAGVFLLILKPFKVGDLISGAGLVGTVKELGLFATTIDTVDGVVTFVGNNKLFGDNIANLSMSRERRVDLTAQLAGSVDPEDAKRRLRAAIAQVPHVLAQPAPVIEIVEFNPMGPVLAVRPFCANEHYWDVYFATNQLIRTEFGAAGYPAPHTTQRLLGALPAA
ncbi:MAG: mechanosensitive ion channel family protein [Kofleriaceae bacterium]